VKRGVVGDSFYCALRIKARRTRKAAWWAAAEQPFKADPVTSKSARVPSGIRDPLDTSGDIAANRGMGEYQRKRVPTGIGNRGERAGLCISRLPDQCAP